MQEGYGEFQVCQEKGVRADAYRQYLKPAMGRSNLTVLTGSQTLGVEFENSRSGQSVARGVTFQQGGPDAEKHTGEYDTLFDCWFVWTKTICTCVWDVRVIVLRCISNTQAPSSKSNCSIAEGGSGPMHSNLIGAGNSQLLLRFGWEFTHETIQDDLCGIHRLSVHSVSFPEPIRSPCLTAEMMTAVHTLSLAYITASPNLRSLKPKRLLQYLCCTEPHLEAWTRFS